MGFSMPECSPRGSHIDSQMEDQKQSKNIKNKELLGSRYGVVL